MSRRRRPPSRQRFDRTDRIAEVVRAVVATELDRLRDERLDLVTVTGVVVDGDLSTARVYYSSLIADQAGRSDQVVTALSEVRYRIQQAVNRTVRARRTPQVTFLPDEVLTHALHIEDLIEGRATTGDDVT